MDGDHRHPLLLKVLWDINSIEFYTTIYSDVRNMQTPVFNKAAIWVHERQKSNMHPAASEVNISDALSALFAFATKCRSAIMVPDLLPGLETIFIPSNSGDHLSTGAVTGLRDDTRITTNALTAIGTALTSELESAGNDLVRYEFDDGSEAIAYLPSARSTVLKATGLVLLND